MPVRSQQVGDHSLLGYGISGRAVGGLQLPIKGFLAHGQGIGAGLGNMPGQIHNRRIQLILGNYPVDQAPRQSGLGGNGGAGQQHFHSLFGVHRPSQSHRRRGAEQANADAGSAESGVFRRHGQIAGRRQLAAGRRSQALHLGDNRLRQQADSFHNGGTFGEKAGETFPVVPHHFPQVMAGTEHRPGGADYRYPRIRVGFDLLQIGFQGGQGRRGQGVAPFRVVQGQQGNGIGQFIKHGGLSHSKRTSLPDAVSVTPGDGGV